MYGERLCHGSPHRSKNFSSGRGQTYVYPGERLCWTQEHNPNQVSELYSLLSGSSSQYDGQMVSDAPKKEKRKNLFSVPMMKVLNYQKLNQYLFKNGWLMELAGVWLNG